MAKATFRIWRGDASGGDFQDYTTEISEGMVVLDAVHQIQAEQANDLAVRWNCKAGKCGSCSAEINGMPKLMCMTRLSDLPLEEPVTVEPMHAFPRLKDLVTDVSWNFRVKKRIKPFKPRPPDAPDGTWRIAQARRRSRTGVSQVHRVLSLPGCLPRPARSSPPRASSSARVSSSIRPPSKCIRSTPRIVSMSCDRTQRHRLLQHHEMLHQGLPREHYDHRQRDHSAERARGGPVLRPARTLVRGSQVGERSLRRR